MSIQQIIIKGIKEQLFLNNYLVLPGFGGFVLKSNAAHFSGALIVPPSKTVSFNSQLKQNDGLLAIWLQAKLSCSNAEALNHLQEFAEFCTGVLNTRRRLSLDTIGFFYLDFENNICFEPQQDANFLTSAFGLAPVALKELEPASITETKKQTVFVDRTLAVEKAADLPKLKRNYARAIVPAALMIVFLSSLLLFVSNTKITGPFNAAVFSNSSKSIYTPLTYPQLAMVAGAADHEGYVADANGVATLALDNDNVIAVKVLNDVVKPAAVTYSKPVRNVAYSAAGRYEIVLGCFTVLENANKMVGKLSKQNIKAFVSEKNDRGMYVVSNGLFADKDQAMAGLAQIKNTYPKAWIKQPE